MATRKKKAAAAAVHAASTTSTAGIRTIRNGSKIGRPRLQFTVGLAIGKTAVRKGSLRGKILQHLRDNPPSTATITALEALFNTSELPNQTRGAVQKLLESGWLKRVT